MIYSAAESTNKGQVLVIGAIYSPNSLYAAAHSWKIR